MSAGCTVLCPKCGEYLESSIEAVGQSISIELFCPACDCALTGSLELAEMQRSEATSPNEAESS